MSIIIAGVTEKGKLILAQFGNKLARNNCPFKSFGCRGNLVETLNNNYSHVSFADPCLEPLNSYSCSSCSYESFAHSTAEAAHTKPKGQTLRAWLVAMSADPVRCKTLKTTPTKLTKELEEIDAKQEKEAERRRNSYLQYEREKAERDRLRRGGL